MIDMHSKYYELICIICIVLIVCTLLLVSMDTTRIHTRELVKIVLGMLCTRTVVCIQYSYSS